MTSSSHQNSCTCRLNNIRFIFSFISFLSIFTCVRGDVVLLNFRNEFDTLSELTICALKKPFINNNSTKNIRFPVVQIKPENPCTAFINSSIQNSAEYFQLSTPQQCSYDLFFKNLQANDPSIVLVGSDGPFSLNSRIPFDTSFVFFPKFMANEVSKFISKNPNTTVLVSDASAKFDWSLIIIWLIAITSIVIGALWTRYEFIKLLPKRNDQSLSTEHLDDNLPDDEIARLNRAKKDAKRRKKEEEDKSMITLSIGYLSIFVLLLIVCGILLLLYYFYHIMIYFVYILFVIGSATAFYRIGSLVLDPIKFGAWKFPKNNIPFLKDHRPEYRKILLFLVSVAISVLWFVFRHENWIWIIQDLMAVALSINALSYYRIETYKSITILLSAFFFYDIFMVFITPTFTNGTSIMEAVAFGGKDSQTSGSQDWSNIQFSPDRTNKNPINRLPVVITVPHLSPSKRLCDFYYEYSYSLLGLGDILIPGISVNYNIIFDYSIHNKFPVYFFINCLAYIFGLMLAFIGLIFMNTAQPALLYLCPVLLIASFITSLVRGEFKEFWYGTAIKMKTSPKENKSFNEGNPSNVDGGFNTSGEP